LEFVTLAHFTHQPLALTP